jgi:hypothetical protein
VHTRAYNQDGVLVAEFKRVVLVPRKHPGESATADPAANASVALDNGDSAPGGVD